MPTKKEYLYYTALKD